MLRKKGLEENKLTLRQRGGKVKTTLTRFEGAEVCFACGDVEKDTLWE